MPVNYHCHFEEGEYYHIYNRGINGENIFKVEENFLFFLSKWKTYIHPHVNTLAYCLMPNHFHFVIRVNEANGTEDTNSYLETKFKRFLSSYALSINKVFHRKGSLMQKRFKRVKIPDTDQLLLLIHYVHHNPIHHKFCHDYAEWKFSSYLSLVSNKPTAISKNHVLDLYGGKNQFLLFHQEMKGFHNIQDIVIED